MAHLVFVVGKSGSGKSTSLRELDPAQTMIINTDQKALPFRKFAESYSKEKGNYTKTSNALRVYNALKKANETPEINVVVVDTWSRIMTDAIMNPEFRAEKGFDKWGVMASNQYDLINYINNSMRDDVIVYFMAHPETQRDEGGFASEKVAVQGKMLDKFVPESFSSIVLYAEVQKVIGQPNTHVFRTVSSGSDTCKSPLGMFEEQFVPNNLVEVNKVIREYYGI